jgi:undecaprenyl-diphosphatase
MLPLPMGVLPGYSGPMTTLQALLLGLFQGIAEFLPISSSGHLLVIQKLMGLSDVPLLFDVILHLGTLLSIIVVFRRRIGGILAAIWRWIVNPGERKTVAETHPGDPENLALVLPAIVATAVTGVIGYLIQKYLPVESPRVVCGLFLVTAALLIVSSRINGGRGYKELGIARGALVGLFQGIGVFPGISRSGITISGGLATGLNRETAGEFAFLLAIPAILGAFVLELKDASALGASVGAFPLALGFVTAFAAGIVALSLLMPIVRKGKLAWFAVYLIPAGVLGLFLFR